LADYSGRIKVDIGWIRRLEGTVLTGWRVNFDLDAPCEQSQSAIEPCGEAITKTRQRLNQLDIEH
jgi:hypothetical protein